MDRGRGGPRHPGRADLALGRRAAVVSAGAGVARARDGGERFLLWLTMPPVLLFALMPLLGQRAIPHWFNSGWLFAFPLVGYWLSARSAGWLRTWSRASAALSSATVLVYLAAVIVGRSWFLPFAPSGVRDPSRFSYDWPDLRSALALAICVPARFRGGRQLARRRPSRRGAGAKSRSAPSPPTLADLLSSATPKHGSARTRSSSFPGRVSRRPARLDPLFRGGRSKRGFRGRPGGPRRACYHLGARANAHARLPLPYGP